jgi:hypothetical protein
MSRFSVRWTATVVSLLLFGGCIDSPIEGPSTIYGRYELLTVNGQAPSVRRDTVDAQIYRTDRRSITLFRGGTYTDSTFGSATNLSGSPVVDIVSVEKGVFTTLGVSITFTAGDRQRNMTWAAGKMTHIEAGITRVYGYQ